MPARFTDRMTSGLKAIPIVLFSLGISACISVSQSAPEITPPQVSHQFLSAPSNSPSISELMTLTQAQREEIHRFVAQEEIADMPPYLQAQAYIYTHVSNFSYRGVNLAAADAMAQKQGNCMSLALMSYAIAKELNVHSRFQMVYTEPVLTDVRNGLAFISDHVRLYLYDAPADAGNVGGFFSPHHKVIIDYFPDPFNRSGGLIDEREFLSLFYRNLAADALADNHHQQAFDLIQAGLALDQDSDSLINLMAVLHRRAGSPELAAAWYDYGIALEQADMTMLSNYRLLAQISGDPIKARQLTRKISQLPNQQPYDLYLLGRDAIREQEYDTALNYLYRFVSRYDYYYPAWIDIAQAYQGQGDTEQARASLVKAIKAANNRDSKIYQSKLNWLNDER